MLIKSDHVNLQGFGGVSQKLPFWVASASEFGFASVRDAVEQKQLRVSRMQWALLGMFGFVVALLALVIGLSRSPATAQGAWSVQSVGIASVSVRMGAIGTASPAVLDVPVGAMLPNGETLISVEPSLQSYSTNTHITVVKK